MKVLIIRVSAIGDVFLTSQLAQYVKIAMPDAEVTWIVEGRCSAVLKGNPYIDKIIV
jgi:ADP-heptose:LPS heptosyltransferase